MIPLSRHSGQILTLAGIPITDPLAIRLGMDEAWSPRIQGSVTLHTNDAALITADAVIVRLRQTFGPDMSVAAITDWWRGSLAAITARVGGSVALVTAQFTKPWNTFEGLRPLAAFTARWGGVVALVTSNPGGRVSKITQEMRQLGGTYSPPPAQVIEVRARIRPAQVSPPDGLIEFAIAGEDILMHDYRRVQGTTYLSPHTSLRALVQFALDYVGLSLAPSADETIPAGAEWAPAQTIFEFLHPVLESVGMTLYADVNTLMRLAPYTPVASVHTYRHDSNLTGFALDITPPYDGAVVEYTGQDPAAYDIYAPLVAQRILHETRESVYPGAGAASELVARSLTRGREATLTATGGYAVRPLDRVAIFPTDLEHQGTVSAIAWDYPNATSTVRIRDYV
jgi:hypothetical protein